MQAWLNPPARLSDEQRRVWKIDQTMQPDPAPIEVMLYWWDAWLTWLQIGDQWILHPSTGTILRIDWSAALAILGEKPKQMDRLRAIEREAIDQLS